MLIPESPGDSFENKDREHCYCLLEIMNTGSSPVEIGKNVKLEMANPLSFVRTKLLKTKPARKEKILRLVDQKSLIPWEHTRCVMLIRWMMRRPHPP